LHQIITAACDRDMYSGWGGVVYTLDSNGVTTEFLKTKQTWMIHTKTLHKLNNEYPDHFWIKKYFYLF
jgi:hypothetical protein